METNETPNRTGWAPWDRPCGGEGCERVATYRVVGHPTVRGVACNAHIPKDGLGELFALDD